MMITLEDAILLALKAHEGRRDLQGRPAILHPLYVMSMLTDRMSQILAVLHDTVEDTRDEGIYKAVDDEELEEALRAITRVPGEIYVNYLSRLSRSRIARTVKIEDLKHNIQRCGTSKKFLPLKRRYLKALEYLGNSRKYE